MGKHRRFTSEELRFIEDKIVGRYCAEVAEMFNGRFGPPVTAGQIKNKITYYKMSGAKRGIRIGRKRQDKRSRRKPAGSEKVMLDGYAKVKTEDGKWVGKHVLIWEGENGKVPEGHRVIFADSDKRNFALDNLLLVSAAEAAVMNALGLRSADPDITRLGHAMAKMRIAAGRAVRERTGARDLWHFRGTKEPGKLKKEGGT